jgi:hypothetical protein
MSYELDAGLRIFDQVLKGENLIIADGQCHGFFDSTLVEGTIKFSQPQLVHRLGSSTLIDCLIHAVKPQRNSQLYSTRFINCRFKGTFSGIDFGHDDERPDDDFGRVEACDFSQARLHGCRFTNTDVVASKIVFPKKDHAVFIEPYKRHEDVKKFKWPNERFDVFMQVTYENDTDIFKALTYHIPSFARWTQCTPEQVREALTQFGGVQIN